MKHLLIPAGFLALAAASCTPGGSNADLSNHNDSLSYALGVMMGQSLSEGELDSVNYDMLARGLRDHSDSVELMDVEAADQFIREHMKRMDDQKNAELKIQGEAFLEENKAKEGVQSTSSGLQYKVIQLGTGPIPGEKDSVQLHYVGTLPDGTVFDSSRENGQPVTFQLNRPMIEGFVEGVRLMPEGSTYQLVIPSELGYGERGGGRIPPGSPLIFEVELLKVYSVK